MKKPMARKCIFLSKVRNDFDFYFTSDMKIVGAEIHHQVQDYLSLIGQNNIVELMFREVLCLGIVFLIIVQSFIT